MLAASSPVVNPPIPASTYAPSIFNAGNGFFSSPLMIGLTIVLCVFGLAIALARLLVWVRSRRSPFGYDGYWSRRSSVDDSDGWHSEWPAEDMPIQFEHLKPKVDSIVINSCLVAQWRDVKDLSRQKNGDKSPEHRIEIGEGLGQVPRQTPTSLSTGSPCDAVITMPNEPLTQIAQEKLIATTSLLTTDAVNIPIIEEGLNASMSTAATTNGQDPKTNLSHDQCGICFETFIDSDEVRDINCECGRYFHQTCVELLFKQHAGPMTCPMCREDVGSSRLPNEKESPSPNEEESPLPNQEVPLSNEEQSAPSDDAV